MNVLLEDPIYVEYPESAYVCRFIVHVADVTVGILDAGNVYVVVYVYADVVFGPPTYSFLYVVSPHFI